MLLKIKIHEDIISGGNVTFSLFELRRFFFRYCNTIEYRKLHKEDGIRYDLDGNEAGKVTKHQVEAKNKRREELKKKWEALQSKWKTDNKIVKKPLNNKFNKNTKTQNRTNKRNSDTKNS